MTGTIKLTVMPRRVLVEPTSPAEWHGSVYLPAVARGKVYFGVVRAAGRGCEAEGLEVGTPVCIDAFKGQELFVDGVLYIVYELHEIIARVVLDQFRVEQTVDDEGLRALDAYRIVDQDGDQYGDLYYSYEDASHEAAAMNAEYLELKR